MADPTFVKVGEDGSEDFMEVPAEANGTLLLTTLKGQFPNAVGLRYKSSSGAWRAVRIANDTLNPPSGGWGETTYNVTISKVASKEPLKRKADETPEEPAKKTKKEESKPPVRPERSERPERAERPPARDAARSERPERSERPPARDSAANDEKPAEGGDLVVLGLAFDCDDDGLKAYFEESCGELAFHEVKYDPNTKKSKGFAFVRFKTAEATRKALEGNHVINGRDCVVQHSKKKGPRPPFQPGESGERKEPYRKREDRFEMDRRIDRGFGGARQNFAPPQEENDVRRRIEELERLRGDTRGAQRGGYDDSRRPRDVPNFRDRDYGRDVPDRGRDTRDSGDLRGVRERDTRDSRNFRDSRDARDSRDLRETRDSRDSRDMRRPPRDAAASRDGREPAREPRDRWESRGRVESRDAVAPRDARGSRERRQSREAKNSRSSRDASRDASHSRDVRDGRDKYSQNDAAYDSRYDKKVQPSVDPYASRVDPYAPRDAKDSRGTARYGDDLGDKYAQSGATYDSRYGQSYQQPLDAQNAQTYKDPYKDLYKDPYAAVDKYPVVDKYSQDQLSYDSRYNPSVQPPLDTQNTYNSVSRDAPWFKDASDSRDKYSQGATAYNSKYDQSLQQPLDTKGTARYGDSRDSRDPYAQTQPAYDDSRYAQSYQQPLDAKNSWSAKDPVEAAYLKQAYDLREKYQSESAYNSKYDQNIQQPVDAQNSRGTKDKDPYDSRGKYSQSDSAYGSRYDQKTTTKDSREATRSRDAHDSRNKYSQSQPAYDTKYDQNYQKPLDPYDSRGAKDSTRPRDARNELAYNFMSDRNPQKLASELQNIHNIQNVLSNILHKNTAR